MNAPELGKRFVANSALLHPEHAQEHQPGAGAAGASGSEEAMGRDAAAGKAKGNKARRVSRRAKARRKRP